MDKAVFFHKEIEKIDMGKSVIRQVKMKRWVAVLMLGSVLLASCSKEDTPVDDSDMGHAPSGVRLIDLGLPSGTKWANMDIGAAGENQPGLFFAFGEVEGSGFDVNDGVYYFWNAYKWGSGTETSDGITKYQMDDQQEGCWYDADGHFIGDGKQTLDPEDDAAVVLWGGKWRIPTEAEMRELVEGCTYEMITIDGMRGCLFTSKTNGATIFFPASGDRSQDEVKGYNQIGFYWTSTVDRERTKNAMILFFTDIPMVNAAFRFGGRPIRPVQ